MLIQFFCKYQKIPEIIARLKKATHKFELWGLKSIAMRKKIVAYMNKSFFSINLYCRNTFYLLL